MIFSRDIPAHASRCAAESASDGGPERNNSRSKKNARQGFGKPGVGVHVGWNSDRRVLSDR